MDLGLKGRRALLLAATKGLGRAAAEGLAAEGATVAISSSNIERCSETAAAITSAYGVKAVGIAANLFEPESMHGLYHQAVAALGGIDIIFINHPGPALGLAKDIDVSVLEPQFRMMVASPTP